MEYPLMSYTVGLVDRSVSISVDGAPASTIVINPGPSPIYPELWGWGNQFVAPYEADPDTCVRALADALALDPGLPAGPYVCEHLRFVGVTAPRWRITIPGGPYTIAFFTEIPELGIRASDVWVVPAVTGYMTSTRRWLGVWSPNSIGVSTEPVYIDDGAQSLSPYNPASQDRVRIARRRVWSASWPYVEAADITRDVMLIDPVLPPTVHPYQILCDRAFDDTWGTLDDLLGAAGSGRAVRLVLGALGDERDGWILADGSIDRSGYTTEETVGGRRYRVAVSMLESALNTDVTT